MTGGVIDARDYGLDLTGANSSADAMEALLADANAEQLAVQLPAGDIVVDRNIGVWRNGTFVQGSPASKRLGGTNIVIPAGPNQAEPWSEFQRGTGARDLRFVQPDQTNAGIDASAYPTVTGSPGVYAPCIQSNHDVAEDGSAGHVNGQGFDFSNLVFNGCYDGIRIRDPHPTNQLGAGWITLSELTGYCLHTDIETGLLVSITTISDVFFSSGLWQDTNIVNDPGQKYNRWRRQNGTSLWLRNRAVGLTVSNYWARMGRRLLRISGGVLDGTGDPAGRVNQSFIDIAGEQFPTMLLVDPDGYLHGTRFRIGGHAKDTDDPACVLPAIDIQTDKTVAGSMNHAEPPAFVAMGAVKGWTAAFDLDLREAAGEIMKVAATDGHGLFTISGTASGWGLGDKTRRAVYVADGASVIIKTKSADFIARRGRGQDVFRLPDRHQLRCIGTDFIGTGEVVSNFDVDHKDRKIFSGCDWRQEGFEGDASDDTEDGD